MRSQLKDLGTSMLWGIVIFALCMISVVATGKADYIDFIITLVIIGSAIGAKLMINEYTSLVANHILNSLVLYMMYIHITMLFTFFLKGAGQSEKIDLRMIWVCSSAFSIVVSLAIVFMLHQCKGKEISDYVITAIYIITTYLVYRYMNGQIFNRVFIVTMILLAIVTNMIYLFYIPQKYMAELGKGRDYFICFAAFRMLEYLLLLTLDHYEYYETACFATHCVKAYYLLKCVLTICIEGPLAEKMMELDKAERMIEAHKENNKMIVNLSHELKTPINVIRSATELLLLDCKEDRQATKAIMRLKMKCNKVMNVIQNMIDIKKVTSHNMNLRFEVFNLVEIIENSIQAFSEEYPECQLIFDPEDEEIDSLVEQELFQQALVQLIVIMVRQDMKAAIEVKIKEMDEKTALIEVRHTSIKWIREILQQLNNMTHEKEIEYHLSMQYINTILDLHGGRLQCVDQEEESYLRIILPLKNDIEQAVTALGEQNVEELREMVRCRYVL